MKNFLTKYFGVIGLLVYVILAVIIRIPVGLFLLVYIAVMLILWNPITRRDDDCQWVNHLYDWYCGK